jgi:hypothetical protein
MCTTKVDPALLCACGAEKASHFQMKQAEDTVETLAMVYPDAWT